MKPGYLREWHAFRKAERAGHAREWLDAQGYCRLSQP
jgi:hypothetical protein